MTSVKQINNEQLSHSNEPGVKVYASEAIFRKGNALRHPEIASSSLELYMSGIRTDRSPGCLEVSE